MTITIHIERKMETLNKVLRWHWSRRAKEKEAWKLELLPFKKAIGRKKFKNVRIISVRKRLLDVDNLTGGAKQLIDGIKEMGWIHDDNPKSCNIEVLQQLGGEGTEIELF